MKSNITLIFACITLILVIGGLIYLVREESNKCVIDPLGYKLSKIGIYNNYKCECSAFDPKMGYQTFDINGGKIYIVSRTNNSWDIPLLNISCKL